MAKKTAKQVTRKTSEPKPEPTPDEGDEVQTMGVDVAKTITTTKSTTCSVGALSVTESETVVEGPDNPGVNFAWAEVAQCPGCARTKGQNVTSTREHVRHHKCTNCGTSYKTPRK